MVAVKLVGLELQKLIFFVEASRRFPWNKSFYENNPKEKSQGFGKWI